MRLPGGESLTYTLTAKDGEVNGDFDFDYYSVSFSMKEMEESVTLPTNTTTVQNFSPREAMDKLNELNIRY